jgi:hypothetical protein
MTLDDVREALSPLIGPGLIEMVVLDGVERYQITERGRVALAAAREGGVIPPKGLSSFGLMETER